MLMINNGNSNSSYDNIVTTNDNIDNGYDKNNHNNKATILTIIINEINQ